MAPVDVLRKAGVEQADVLREGVRVLAQELMELEVTELLGAERHERSGYRNGCRERPRHTRVGTIELQVPRIRDGRSEERPGAGLEERTSHGRCHAANHL